ncbi:MAG: hypothetical protein ACTS77_00470 [Arsenophonus sp. NC-TX2-MAG3]
MCLLLLEVKNEIYTSYDVVDIAKHLIQISFFEAFDERTVEAINKQIFR